MLHETTYKHIAMLLSHLSKKFCAKAATAILFPLVSLTLNAQEILPHDTIPQIRDTAKAVPATPPANPARHTTDDIFITPDLSKTTPVFVPRKFNHVSNISVTKQKFWGNLRPTSLIVPATLIAVGTWGNENDWFVKQNKEIRDELQENRHSALHIDDYTQFLPFAAALTLGNMGLKARHGLKQRAIAGGMAIAISQIFVQSLKYTTRTERPDHSKRNSFPSGHTTMAFVGAEMLWQEYHQQSPWIAYAGYAVAAGTGFMRMYNNRHWFSDVIAGAGFGILSTKLAYWLYPKIFHTTDNNRQTALNITPTLCGEKSIGMAATLDF